MWVTKLLISPVKKGFFAPKLHFFERGASLSYGCKNTVRVHPHRWWHISFFRPPSTAHATILEVSGYFGVFLAWPIKELEMRSCRPLATRDPRRQPTPVNRRKQPEKQEIGVNRREQGEKQETGGNRRKQ